MKIKRPFKIGKTMFLGRGTKFSRLFGLSVVAVVVATTFSLPQAFAAPSGNDYEKLESKFFSRTYPKDTSDARLDRLEKLVFGEAKEGADRDRLDNLLKLIPSVKDDIADGGGADGGASQAAAKKPSSQPAKAASTGSTRPAAPAADDDGGGSQYPAVTAIEKKLFGKDFESEHVEDRLTRLEKKAFGKQSSSSDLSERTDALKAKTGIDVAHQSGSGSEWNDEDENDTDYPEPSAPVARRYPGVSPSDSGKSFSGRDIGADLNRAFNRQPAGGGSGAYGMGGSSGYSSSGSGSYGFGGGSSTGFRGRPAPAFGNGQAYRSSSSPSLGGGSSSASSPFGGSTAGARRAAAAPVDPDDSTNLAYAPPAAPRRGVMPPVAPPVVRGGAGAANSAASGGLSFQLEALETQVFGKTYKDPLIQRLERLETTVFPGDKNSKSRTPIERVARLAQVIPIGGGGQPVAQNPNQDLDGDGQVDMSQIPADQSSIAQQSLPKSRGGLGKIMNSLGNFLGGGMSVGSFPMNSGASNLVTDPQTGMLLDQYSGNLINPTTGAVVGRKAGMGYPTTMPTYGMNSFNNGFSSPYYGNSMYSNPAFGGIGGSGVRFGTGGVRFGGGMWP